LVENLSSGTLDLGQLGYSSAVVKIENWHWCRFSLL